MAAETVEWHPFGYGWSRRLPDHELIAGGEGGAVYSARGEGALWVITDEGTLADFLDPVDDAALLAMLIKLERFGDQAAWDTRIDEVRRSLAPPAGDRE